MHRRHQQNIPVVTATRSAQVRVRESINNRIRIMIPAAAIPASVNACIGRELHHSKWHHCAGEGVSVTASTDEGIDVVSKVWLPKTQNRNEDGQKPNNGEEK